jgi:hypothetical protein
MRVLAILALTALLFGPSVVPPKSDRETKPALSVLIDVSASMQTVDCGDRSRLDALRDTWLRSTILSNLERVADVDYHLVGTVSEPVSRNAVEMLQNEAASAEATNLFASLRDALAASPSTSRRVLVLSDGRDTSGGSAGAIAEVARSRGVPIDTVCAGAAVQRRDLAVHIAPTQEFLYADEEGGLLLRVHQTGLPVAVVDVELSVSGPDGASQQRHSLDLRGRTIAETLIPIRHERPGQYAYVVQAAERPEERDAVNNKAIVFVEVSKAKAQVLMLEGQPSWDMKFVAQSLRKDPRVELTQISRLSERRTEVIRSGGKQGAKSDLAEILSPEGLARVDVFILGSGLERVLTPERAAIIRDRVVDHGAGVIFSRGPAYDATSDAIAAAFAIIEPVRYDERAKASFTDVSIQLRPAARSLPWLSKEQLGVDLERESMRLAPWQRVYAVRDVKPSAIVVASVASPQSSGTIVDDAGKSTLAPAVVSMRAGSGIALSILGEGMWKWALVDRERAAFQGVYERWWQGMVRWCASGGDARPGQDATLRLSQQTARLNERIGIEVILERTLLQPPTEVRVQLPNGRTERLLLARLSQRSRVSIS